ncbi:putative transcriptional regulator [Frankia casuarinae]|uniref:Transcriptional regulator n=1 Tax=Frankia casuarinae (strain DSM 45818 / CECT 9043 / HFP020203 / CcI3) TaxID=106370 RepID=Q2JG93_FRACC|nr:MULTISPECIES: WYL domain-containing protein [Frankia]ABD09699.1 putative transcriptional regulator [Frankia casuarinae]ETA02319.1 putative transcriptional regulator [Frankia sp. CcI6]EYT92942.1 putative transcriptional regulator [Frankia casuarinae]KDA43353.1 putative transcriptional regulator [Frankia sp. BMG5.23]KFB03488.1 putative transcriptional regulator [Frankia sp. Allo2]
MRASRLLSVLLLLQTRGRLTAREIADELEVSVRTVYRDLESLAEAGVPVLADRGATGGYRLLDGFRTRLTGLTSGEADSLFLAGMPAAAGELGLGTMLAAAELKLMAALPEQLRERAGRVRERFHLDAPGWFRATEDTPLLTEVAAAVWEQRRVRVTYRRWRAPREIIRHLEPLGVVLKGGTWYLVANVAHGTQGVGLAEDAGSTRDPDGTRAAGATESADGSGGTEPAGGPATLPRVYRVAKILSLETTTETFERPHSFDLGAYWAGWTARYESEVYRTRATVRLSPTGVTMAPFRLPPAVARAVRETASAPEEDGWVRAVVPIESVRHAERELLVLGPDLEVLHPPELREAVTRAVGALAALYGAPAPGNDGSRRPVAGNHNLPAP